MIDFRRQDIDNQLAMCGLGRVRLQHVAAFALCTVTAGCTLLENWFDRPRSVQSNDSVETERYSPFCDDRSSRPDDVIVVRMMFDVERIAIPSDVSSADREEIWKFVDELRIPPAVIAHLKRNGFRIGVINQAGRDALQPILDRIDARSEVGSYPVQTGFPLTLNFGALPPDSTVFTFQKDGALIGTTFASGTKYLHVDYAGELSDTPRTKLRITPEIYKRSENPHWSVTGEQVHFEKLYQGNVYHDLAVDLDTGPGELVVIGKASGQDNRFVLGSTLLTQESGGRIWETIVCIEPRLYRTARPESQP